MQLAAPEEALMAAQREAVVRNALVALSAQRAAVRSKNKHNWRLNKSFVLSAAIQALLRMAGFKLKDKFKQQPFSCLQDLYTADWTVFCRVKCLMELNESLFIFCGCLCSFSLSPPHRHSLCRGLASLCKTFANMYDVFACGKALPPNVFLKDELTVL